jgi:hypothetical protein
MSRKSRTLYKAPSVEELAEKYKGTNVCIVAQGPSGKRDLSQYSDADDPDCPNEPWFIWTQNGGWVTHTYSSLGFIMDDLRCDVWDNIKRFTRGEIEAIVKNAKIPLVTSKSYPEYPALVEFPLKQAMDTLPKINKSLNLNETINYMVACAIMWGVKRLDLWGVDYLTPEGVPIRPDKRACCELWLGMAAMAGIQIRTYAGSDLLRYGLHHPDTEIEGVYGYQQSGLPENVLDSLELIGAGRAQIKVGTSGRSRDA